MKNTDDHNRTTQEPEPGMMGAGVGVFLRHVRELAQMPSEHRLAQELCDNADPIVRDIYLAMMEALEREGR